MSSAEGNRRVRTKKNDLRDVTGISIIMLKHLAPITSKCPLYVRDVLQCPSAWLDAHCRLDVLHHLGTPLCPY